MNLKSLAVVVSCMCCLSVPVQANAAEDEMATVNAASTGEIEPLAAGLISVYLGTKINLTLLRFYKQNPYI